ncbi:esterase/lipase family protein [Kitasatospora phosalacinea]|uniref:Esterase/lipase family protein n=1 Tax=Kitasatospora phosalacinea TaxID=2065 RepID=A0ABW6GUN3_9ACTN
MRPIRRLRTLCLPLLVALAAAFLTGGPASAATDPSHRTPLPVNYSVYGAAVAELTGAGSPPPGANDWTCKPSAAHPRPVVLVHALLVNQTMNWNAVSPALYNAGYCVFAFDYGNTLGSAFPFNQIGGLQSMTTSAADLGAFVDRVRAATGSDKVDLVGHSEGGVVAAAYAKLVPGAAQKAGEIITFGSPVHGTDMYLLGTLKQALSKVGLGPIIDGVVDSVCTACTELLVGSDFNATLNAGGVAVPGPHYTTVASTYDTIAWPLDRDLITAPNATKVVLQDTCWGDFTDHVNLAFDPNVIGWTLHALDPAHTGKPACRLFVPYL